MAASEIYRVYTVKVPPSSATSIQAEGTYVAPLVSSLDDFEIGLDDGPTSFMQVGLQLRTLNGERFTRVNIENTDAALTLTLQIAVGIGDLRDARLSLTGIVTVKGQGNGGAVVVEPTRLLGTSRAVQLGIGTAALSVISPASNTNGLILATASIAVASGTYGGLIAHTSAPNLQTSGHILLIGGGGVGAVTNLPSPIFLPAGLGVYGDSASLSTIDVWLTWTALP